MVNKKFKDLVELYIYCKVKLFIFLTKYLLIVIKWLEIIKLLKVISFLKKYELVVLFILFIYLIRISILFNTQGYFLVRFIILMIIIVLTIIYKSIYILLLRINEATYKNFFLNHVIINKSCLFIVKWSNLFFLYNDIEIIIMYLLKNFRFNFSGIIENKKNFSWKKSELFLNAKNRYNLTLTLKDILLNCFESFIYIIFFIIIRNIIILITKILKNIKKHIVKNEFKFILKRRLLIWLLLSYLIIVFNFKLSLYLIILLILLKSLDKSLEDINIWYKKRWYFMEYYSYENIRKNTDDALYDELNETLYILKNCNYPRDIDLDRINLWASSKLVNFESSILRIFNSNKYWYQNILYYYDIEGDVDMVLMSNLMYMLKVNLWWLLMIKNYKRLLKLKKEGNLKGLDLDLYDTNLKDNLEYLDCYDLKEIEKELKEGIVYFKKVWELIKDCGFYNNIRYKIKLLYIRKEDERDSSSFYFEDDIPYDYREINFKIEVDISVYKKKKKKKTINKREIKRRIKKNYNKYWKKLYEIEKKVNKFKITWSYEKIFTWNSEIINFSDERKIIRKYDNAELSRKFIDEKNESLDVNKKIIKEVLGFYLKEDDYILKTTFYANYGDLLDEIQSEKFWKNLGVVMGNIDKMMERLKKEEKKRLKKIKKKKE